MAERTCKVLEILIPWKTLTRQINLKLQRVAQKVSNSDSLENIDTKICAKMAESSL